MPPEFDFGYWNTAPRDQQCPYPEGDEIITLNNVCALDHPAATQNKDGHTQLRFQLPGTVLYLALEDAQGRIALKMLNIDTLTIDPEASRVDVIWRAVISTAVQLKNVQLRMACDAQDKQGIAAMMTWQRGASRNAMEAAPQEVSDGA